MILVDTLSCGHFVVFLSFSYSSWTCCHVDFFFFVILIFLVDTLSFGHFVVFLSFSYTRGHVVWTFVVFLSFEYSLWARRLVDTSLFFFYFHISRGHAVM